jgi:pseudouridine kinase
MSQRARVLVVGGANVDIVGRSDAPLDAHDSVPGAVRVCAGGVGRNVAENLSKLGPAVTLVSAWGADHWGVYLRQQCEQAGIDIASGLTVAQQPSGVYMALMREIQELHGVLKTVETLFVVDAMQGQDAVNTRSTPPRPSATLCP